MPSYVLKCMGTADCLLSKPAMKRVDTSGSRRSSVIGFPAMQTKIVTDVNDLKRIIPWTSALGIQHMFRTHHERAHIAGWALIICFRAREMLRLQSSQSLPEPCKRWSLVVMGLHQQSHFCECGVHVMQYLDLSILERTSLGVLDVQEVGSNAGFLRALLAHAVHKALHDAVEALCHRRACPYILHILLCVSCPATIARKLANSAYCAPSSVLSCRH